MLLTFNMHLAFSLLPFFSTTNTQASVYYSDDNEQRNSLELAKNVFGVKYSDNGLRSLIVLGVIEL